MITRIKKIETKYAPEAIGPYSQAILTGDYLFVSGQIPLDPESGLIIGDDIRAQTRHTLKNLKAILDSENIPLDNVVKTEVFLHNMSDFSVMNDEYAKIFNGPIKPARQVVEVSKLPKDAKVEISCIAVAIK